MKSEYSVATGFFVQDDASTVDPLPPRFGLLDDSPERWASFTEKIKKLNEEAPEGTSYKSIFAGRHGEGWHNVAMAKYSHDEWNDHLAAQTGDGTIIWGPDPHLTSIGEGQASYAHAMWKQELSSSNIPLPTKFYCSPLSRALQTCLITFDPIVDFKSCAEGRRPLVIEDCRERFGVSTCDQRRPKSYIQSTFGEKVTIDENLPEEDVIFKPDERETYEHVADRVRAVLDRIFDERNKDDLVISITAHNGWINTLISVTGHAHYDLPTGGVLPMVVKCVKL
ncbi:phosphoglycerate mutase-like protein [Schizopora paradoxa]|uniref:Phosphoglycerate mutase-like protein n=1 Tax=Schizopora paradoxa TaxID=27342 RepID=A0A0H2RHJ7_9AGAM|nr:phosphoglycerate mutase-like protein [Schizopora paradoxa]